MIKPAHAIIESLMHPHDLVLKKVDELYETINCLQYEGGCQCDKNIKKIESIMGLIKGVFLPHIELDDQVVFEFIGSHLPRLEPVLDFLKGEHKELTECFIAFDELLTDLKNESSPEGRVALIEKLKDKGTYIFCLLRSHIRSENEIILKRADHELDIKEKEELLKMCQGFAPQQRMNT